MASSQRCVNPCTPAGAQRGQFLGAVLVARGHTWRSPCLLLSLWPALNLPSFGYFRSLSTSAETQRRGTLSQLELLLVSRPRSVPLWVRVPVLMLSSICTHGLPGGCSWL